MPALSLPALRKQIADRRLAPVYLFIGEDVKLVGRLVEAIETVIDPADRAFAIDRLYAGEDGGAPADIAATARTMPMLGDRRIVVVLRAERLLKPKRTAKAKDDGADDQEGNAGEDSGSSADAAALEDYLDKPVDFSTVVFVATDIDRTRRLTKRVIASAQLVEFNGLGGSARDGRGGGAVDWLREELTRAGKEIEPEAARMLVSRSGGDITRLRGDVERLLLFAEGRTRISGDDVLEIAAEHLAVDDEWAVVNAISDGDAARALVEVSLRLERGDSPHALVGQLRWWVSNRLAQGAPARTKAALEALLRTDLALKSSGGEERVLLERLVVELTGKPVAPQRGGWSGTR